MKEKESYTEELTGHSRHEHGKKRMEEMSELLGVEFILDKNNTKYIIGVKK